MLELRQLRDDEWPVWRDLRIAALTDAPHVFRSRLADWETTGERRWRARMERPDTFNVYAVLDDVPVGMASGVPDDAGEAYLRSLWVSPDARGHGVGEGLIDRVRTWAEEAWAGVLKLAVVPDNEAAIALYLKNGFVMTDELGEPLAGGVTREKVMVRSGRR